MRRFQVNHDISCETQLLELVSLNSVGHPVLWSSCCPSFRLSITSPDNCLTAQTCAPVTDCNLESDCVMIRPSSTAQEKVPFSHTSAHVVFIQIGNAQASDMLLVTCKWRRKVGMRRGGEEGFLLRGREERGLGIGCPRGSPSHLLTKKHIAKPCFLSGPNLDRETVPNIIRIRQHRGRWPPAGSTQSSHSQSESAPNSRHSSLTV